MTSLNINPLQNWGVGVELGKRLFISGPCSAATEEQVLETCIRLAKKPLVHILRAGIWKPRTRPNSFEGVGSIGLRWLKEAGKETGLPVCTEVANAKHVYEALRMGIDILWIGARTTVNPFAVQEIADALVGVDVPVMVKNPGRGVIAEDYTFDNVRRCPQGFANYMLSQGKQGQFVVVGYDKRFSREHFAASVAEVLAGNGLKVYLTQEATPTPVIAYAVVNKKAAGAVNVTASHNPPTDNGFKVRNETGGAIDPEGLIQIETGIPDDIKDLKRKNYKEAEAAGEIILFDAATPYIDHLTQEGLIDLQPIKDAGLTVMVDTTWGNGRGLVPAFAGGRQDQSHLNP